MPRIIWTHQPFLSISQFSWKFFSGWWRPQKFVSFLVIVGKLLIPLLQRILQRLHWTLVGITWLTGCGGGWEWQVSSWGTWDGACAGHEIISCGSCRASACNWIVLTGPVTLLRPMRSVIFFAWHVDPLSLAFPTQAFQTQNKIYYVIIKKKG